MIIRRKNRGGRPKARGAVGTPRTETFRYGIVRMHREIFRRNRKRINTSVSGYTAAFRRYEKEYAEGTQSYWRRVAFGQLDRAIDRANIVYVGDYHTLPQAQRGFLRVLRRIHEDRPVAIALEFIQGRHQAAIDSYLAGQIGDEAFLAAIHHDTHWLFGGWESFRLIFALAKARGYRVIGIDTLGRGPAGASLQARDRYAARCIAAERRRHPDHLIMVLIGELHIAPPHLPAQVTIACRRSHPELRSLVLYQNCEEIYWELEARGLEHDTELVQVSANEYCLTNTPPIVCQQSFLNWLQAEDAGLEWEAPEETFKECVRLITAFFDLEVGDAIEEVEVATVVDLSFLARLKKRGDFSSGDIEKIRAQILSSESYYIPRAKMVYLGNLSMNHAAEEATHFVRHVCSLSEGPNLLVDAFYWRVMEEAIGFLGSKVINHKRKCAHLGHFKRIARSKSATPFEKDLARLVRKHARLERGERVRGSSEVYECSADLFNAVTHVLGYQLGDRLYYGLVRGELAKSEIRDLFFDSFEGKGDALATYLYLAARTQNVILPERM